MHNKVTGKLKSAEILQSSNCIEATATSSEVTLLDKCKIKIEPNQEEEHSLNVHLPSELNNLDSEVRDKIEDALLSFIFSKKRIKGNVFMNVVKKSNVLSEEVQPKVPYGDISLLSDDFINEEIKEENFSNDIVQDYVDNQADINNKELKIKNEKFLVKIKEEGEEEYKELFSKQTTPNYSDFSIWSTECSVTDFMCDICGLIFKSKKIFNGHRFLHGNPDGFQEFKCETCSKSFLNSYQLEDHIPTHESNKEFLCSYCGKQYCTKKQLLGHLVIHSKERFMCTVCNLPFRSKSTFRAHAKSHSHVFAFKCKICFELFETKRKLVIHRRSHKFEFNANTTKKGKKKFYECNVCKKKLKSKYSLQLHEKRHTGEKSYICHCGESFKTPGGLKTHFFTHPTEFLSCKHCDVQFPTKLQLSVHVRKEHLSTELFICDECGDKFHNKKVLIQHLSLHDSERKFSCLYCPRKFKSQFPLYQHVQTHTDECSYACKICGQTFKKKGDRNKHQTSHERKKKS